MNYKEISFTILVFFILLLSCKKDENGFQSTGKITGLDLGMCICCGGYFIEIGDSTFNFDALPLSSEIDLSSATFPITVNLDWLYGRKCGDIQYIQITRLEKQ